MKYYRTVMLIIKTEINSCGRHGLEIVENKKFDSIEAIQNVICFDENYPMAVEDLAIIEMTDFVDLCNNTDDDTPEKERIDISKVWIGHVQLNKSCKLN